MTLLVAEAFRSAALATEPQDIPPALAWSWEWNRRWGNKGFRRQDSDTTVHDGLGLADNPSPAVMALSLRNLQHWRAARPVDARPPS